MTPITKVKLHAREHYEKVDRKDESHVLPGEALALVAHWLHTAAAAHAKTLYSNVNTTKRNAETSNDT